MGWLVGCGKHGGLCGGKKGHRSLHSFEGSVGLWQATDTKPGAWSGGGNKLRSKNSISARGSTGAHCGTLVESVVLWSNV